MNPASANNGASIMQAPATILRKWWASDMPNITSPPCSSPRSKGRGQGHLHPCRSGVTGILAVVTDPVEIFQAAVDALNRVDRDTMAQLIDPQIAFIPLRAAVTGPFIGHKGMDDFLAENA